MHGYRDIKKNNIFCNGGVIAQGWQSGVTRILEESTNGRLH